MPTGRKYFTQWRSKERCEAMQLAETTRLPVEGFDPEATDLTNFADFAPGDYQVMQNGRVFGRSKADHESRFETTVKHASKTTTKTVKRAVKRAEPKQPEPKMEAETGVNAATGN